MFLALIRDARRFDPSRGSLGAFLVGIARNHLKKRWEQDRRLVIVGDASSDGLERAITKEEFGGVGEYKSDGRVEQAASELMAMDRVEMVRKVIATLPEKYREVVVLCDLQEMSYEKAAASLGCPVGTVRSRLHRGRAMLLEKFREKKSYSSRCRASGGEHRQRRMGSPAFEGRRRRPMNRSDEYRQKLSCEEFEAAVWDRDPGFDVGSLPSEFREHAAFCARCASLLTDADELKGLLQDLAEADARQALSPSTEARLLQAFRESQGLGADRKVLWHGAALAAVAMVLLILSIAVHRFMVPASSPGFLRTCCIESD